MPARAVYSEPVRPLAAAEHAARRSRSTTTCSISPTSRGKRILTTRYAHSITVREENAAAALEVMVRFAIDPQMADLSAADHVAVRDLGAGWISGASGRGVGVLSRSWRRDSHVRGKAHGLARRSGGRARCRRARSVGSASTNGRAGLIYTRTGRAFFTDRAQTREVVARTAAAAEAAGLFEELATDWLCLDAEIMPWSAKAQSLIEQQYGPVGAAARTGLDSAQAAAARATARGIDVGRSRGAPRERKRERADRFAAAVRQYCWPVDGLDGVTIAPFHLLASEGRVHSASRHAWHMSDAGTARRARSAVPGDAHASWSICRTKRALQRAIDWWLEMTGAGGEGMVVKPRDLPGTRRQGPPGAACHQVPRPRLSAHHLWPRLRPARESRAPA